MHVDTHSLFRMHVGNDGENFEGNCYHIAMEIGTQKVFCNFFHPFAPRVHNGDM